MGFIIVRKINQQNIPIIMLHLKYHSYYQILGNIQNLYKCVNKKEIEKALQKFETMNFIASENSYLFGVYSQSKKEEMDFSHYNSCDLQIAFTFSKKGRKNRFFD